MARIRTIKPEFFVHDGLFDLEHETGLPVRLAFAGLWCQADREGLFRWRPRMLKAAILPYDDVDFSRVLGALATRRFIVKYASAGEEFGLIPTFKRHQVINNRERPSDLPSPDANNVANATSTGEARVGDSSSTREEGVRNTAQGERNGNGTGTGREEELEKETGRPVVDSLEEGAGRNQSEPGWELEFECLRHVKAADLKCESTLCGIHRALNAERPSEIPADETSLVSIIAAAEHAIRHATENRTGLFKYLVSNPKKARLDADDKATARRRLAQHRDGIACARREKRTLNLELIPLCDELAEDQGVTESAAIASVPVHDLDAAALEEAHGKDLTSMSATEFAELSREAYGQHGRALDRDNLQPYQRNKLLRCIAQRATGAPSVAATHDSS